MSASTPQSTPKVVYGIANWGTLPPDSPGDLIKVRNPTEAAPYLSILQAHNVNTLDTSAAYPNQNPGSSELALGSCISDPSSSTTTSSLVIDTKVLSNPGEHRSSKILASISKSLSALQVPKVNILYLHWPDRTVPLEEPLKGMDEAYRAGLFEHFGISNYAASEIEEMMAICERHGWVKPSVYQGQYNPLCRRGEQQLFPTLRKYGISFYAWSPAAGGAFSKTSQRMGRTVSTTPTCMYYRPLFSSPL